MDIILLPFRVVRASVSAAFRTTVTSSQAARSLFIDWDWLEPAQEAVTDTVSSMAMPTLKLVLLLVLATFSFASSASVYFAFYQFYIPQIHHQFPLYFDFRYSLAPFIRPIFWLQRCKLNRGEHSDRAHSESGVPVLS